MNKILLLIVNVLFCLSLFSQTNYYKLVRIDSNGTTTTTVGGGQFVSFTKNQRSCYESDCEGFSVGNGRLERDESENGWDAYYGTSYWGAKTTFLFNKDKSRLKVRTASGDIYEYCYATPPKGITTCSLIRSTVDNDGVGEPVSIFPSQSPVIDDDGSHRDNTPRPERPQRQKSVKRECPLCHGEKRIVHNSYPPMYGQTDYKVRCERCGQSFMKSTGHQHIICTQCHGLGYYIVK